MCHNEWCAIFDRPIFSSHQATLHHVLSLWNDYKGDTINCPSSLIWKVRHDFLTCSGFIGLKGVAPGWLLQTIRKQSWMRIIRCVWDNGFVLHLCHGWAHQYQTMMHTVHWKIAKVATGGPVRGISYSVWHGQEVIGGGEGWHVDQCVVEEQEDILPYLLPTTNPIWDK